MNQKIKPIINKSNYSKKSVKQEIYGEKVDDLINVLNCYCPGVFSLRRRKTYCEECHACYMTKCLTYRLDLNFSVNLKGMFKDKLKYYDDKSDYYVLSCYRRKMGIKEFDHF